MKLKKVPPTNPAPSSPPPPATTNHDINKAMLVVGAGLLEALTVASEELLH